MERYLELIYQLPAIVAGTTLVSYLSPVKIVPRLMPLIMFVVALIVLALPAYPDLALAMTLPAAWLSHYLGISFHDHEPLGVPKIRLPKRIEIQKFAAQAFPNPDDETAGQGDDEEDDAPPPDLEPGGTVSTVRSFVPKL